jgi:hypothetical protein
MCNGGRNKYATYCNQGHTNLMQDAQNCVNKLPYVTRLPWGCVTAQSGGCKCTVDTPYANNWSGTFSEATANLFQGCPNSIEAERYEGSMYLTYTCSAWCVTDRKFKYTHMLFCFFFNKENIHSAAVCEEELLSHWVSSSIVPSNWPTDQIAANYIRLALLSFAEVKVLTNRAFFHFFFVYLYKNVRSMFSTVARFSIENGESNLTVNEVHILR